MFGYVYPEKMELKVREYEIFKAYYCGVCRKIGKRYGQLPRFTLNYDCTFLGLLLHSLTEKENNIMPKRCIAHPLRKRPMASDGKSLDYAADMNVILAYLNMKDDWQDDKNIISGAGCAGLFMAYKKAEKNYLKKCREIICELDKLRCLEEKNIKSIDQTAECFSKVMMSVCVPDWIDERNKSILSYLAVNMGKWIYILDAYDDIDKDAKKDVYNPILVYYEFENDNTNEFKGRIKEEIEFYLTQCLSEISKAYELFEFKSNSSIIDNIIYLGMLRKTEKILASCQQ